MTNLDTPENKVIAKTKSENNADTIDNFAVIGNAEDNALEA